VTAALDNIARQNKLSLRDFKAALERDGYSFEHFRDNVREQIVISRLQQRQVGSLVTVSEQEVENYLKERSGKGDTEQEYHLAHILVALPEGSTPEKIEAARAKAGRLHGELVAGADFAQLSAQESNAQQALEGGDLGWRSAAQIPTLFAQVVSKLAPGAISEVVRSPSGFHLIKLIETRGLGQHVVEQMDLRHILLRAGDLADKDELRERLHQLKARIEGGEDFAALARAHSQDPATASRGGALGWLSSGELPPGFAEAVVKLAQGAVSEPFETEIGLHIAQIIAKRRHDDSDAYRRSVARDQIRARKAEEELEVWLRRLRDESYVEYRDGAG
jgi:peptidyl-prolyl cis-trans isomerase SurA